MNPVHADQIGIVVRDLDEAMGRYGRIFAAGSWNVWTYRPAMMSECRFRGDPGSFAMRLALAGKGPQIELIEPLAGPSLYHEWLDAHGEGLHHIGAYVPELRPAVADMEARGHAVLQLGYGYGAAGDGGFAYLDTTAELGITLELIEVPVQRRAPDAVVQPSSAA